MGPWRGCPLEWVTTTVACLVLAQVTGGCWPGLMVEVRAGFLAAVHGVDGPWLCGFDGEVLRQRRCEATRTVLPQTLEVWRSVVIRMKVLLGFAGPVAMAPAGVVPLLGGVAKVCSHLPPSLGIGSGHRAKALIRKIGMIAASSTLSLCWEHHVWRHGLEVLHRAPLVFATVHGRSSAAQCTAIASDPKTVPFSGINQI